MATGKKYSNGQRLIFPKYGEIGYEDQNPVGKKHIHTKLSAIHQIIFNQEAKLPPRKVYNQIKMNFKQQIQNLSSQSNSPRYLRKQSLQQSPHKTHQKAHKYDIMQRQSMEDNLKSEQPVVYINDFLQRQSQQLLKSSNKKHYYKHNERLDSLDKIIDPYKNYQAMMRHRRSFNQNMSKSYQENTVGINQIHQQSNLSNHYKEGVVSPTFLNSML